MGANNLNQSPGHQTPNRVVAAIVGAGFMGSVHSRALRAAGIDIAGIMSSSPKSSAVSAKALGIEQTYTSYSEMLEDPKVNLIHILTPNQTHAELVDLALDAGKNVVCEKPLTIETEDAIRLADKAEALGLVGAVPFVYRYHPMIREAKSKAKESGFGKIHSVRGEYLQDWLLSAEDSNWRVDDNLGGPSRAFADIGIHLCDLIEFVTGEEIVNLVSKLQTVYQHRQGKKVLNEDTAAIIAQLQGGAIVSLMISQVAAGHKNGLVLEVDGSQKALRFEQENPELLWVGSSSESTILNRDPRNLSPDAQRLTKLPAGHPEGYFDAFVSFMRDVELAIQGGEPFGLPSFRDGVRSSVLTNAVIASSKTNRWVPII